MGENVSLLAIERGSFRDLTHAPMSMQCFIYVKVNCDFLIENFLFLAVARNRIMLRHLIICFLLPDYLSSVRLQEVKNKGKLQTFSSKSGRGRSPEVVVYKRFQI